ncbi:class I SAM-dependent DNA methyltransferase [uncultured Prevotella sp.]|uniref:type I restriction-modification system subunit M n=1 Tax=uncultured Prevotella sp. TaxID=159272 RepID=UPI0025962A1E|nr:class I SAM-dependent DNA methyltransferase [uncultured Prevotella sp.]
MEQSQYNALFSFIWNIANDVLVNAFNKGDYKRIILPMLVLRRIDVLLEPTKDSVLERKEQLDAAHFENQAPLLTAVTGYPFYNTSKFTMKTLKSEIDPLRLKMNFIDYLNGYSKDVLDIIDKMHIRQIVDNLTEAERLGSIIEKFTSDKINLSSKPVLDGEGNVVHPALDNHTVGTMFEELLRKFNEENNVTEAGEHFTPRDYVNLLADIAVLPVADKITDTTYSIYDGACGTGGILTIAQERISQIAKEKGKNVNINIYGQELLADTYATCKADLMISGHVKSFQYQYAGSEREYIAFDSTISRDGHAGETFDFCISNPPFGTPWKEDLKKRGLTEKEKAKYTDSRFTISVGSGDERKEISFLPDISDCQMLFLANNISRMVDDTELGTRIVEVHNGSSLFTGNAGSGASNLRQYIIENDLLEAIIAMPEKDFYNTGIGTYIWVVTNRKEDRRRGKVQLIDATGIKTPLRKNLGEKNCETNEDDRRTILKMLTDFSETEQSKIFPNQEFGYWSVTVERPLRIVYENPENITLPELKKAEDVALLQRVLDAWKEYLGGHTVGDYAMFIMLDQMKIKVPAAKIKLVRQYLGRRDERADVCHTKPTKLNSPVECDPMLRDVEQVPLLYPGGIDAFMENEVKPYAPDAYYNADDVVVGYELSFTKYFYKPVELRPIADITADINNIESSLKGVLGDILNV